MQQEIVRDSGVKKVISIQGQFMFSHGFSVKALVIHWPHSPMINGENPIRKIANNPNGNFVR